MNSELKLKVDLMVENYNELKRNFIWDMGLLKNFCAIML